jgi:hypothetical protein
MKSSVRSFGETSDGRQGRKGKAIEHTSRQEERPKNKHVLTIEPRQLFQLDVLDDMEPTAPLLPRRLSHDGDRILGRSGTPEPVERAGLWRRSSSG